MFLKALNTEDTHKTFGSLHVENERAFHKI